MSGHAARAPGRSSRAPLGPAPLGRTAHAGFEAAVPAPFPGPQSWGAGGLQPRPRASQGAGKTTMWRPAHLGTPLRSVWLPSHSRTTQPGPGRRCDRPPAARPSQLLAWRLQRRPSPPRLPAGVPPCSAEGRLRWAPGARPPQQAQGSRPAPAPYLKHAFVLLGADIHSLEGQRRRLRPALGRLHLLGGHRRSVRRLLGSWAPGTSQALSAAGPICTGCGRDGAGAAAAELQTGRKLEHLCLPARSRPAAESGAGAGVGG